jgi:hypothetical protein
MLCARQRAYLSRAPVTAASRSTSIGFYGRRRNEPSVQAAPRPPCHFHVLT